MASPSSGPDVYPPQVFDCRSLFMDKGKAWGFPRGASILITGTPGAGKSFLALALARGLLFSGQPATHLIRPDHVLYFISAELDRDRMERNFKTTGWFEKADPLFAGRDHDPDACFSLLSARVDLGRPVPSSEELVNGLLVELRERHVNRPPGTSAIVIVDSLTALLRDCTDRGEERRQTHEFIRRLETAVGRENLALTLFISEETDAPATSVNVEDYVVDFVIHLALDKAAGGRRSRTLEVIKSHGAYLRIGLHSWAIVTSEGVDGVIAVDELRAAIGNLALGKLNIDAIYDEVASTPLPVDAPPWATVAIFASGALRPIGTIQKAKARDHIAERPAISSGIPGLDHMLEYSAEGRAYWTSSELGISQENPLSHCLPTGSTTVISGLAGAGKTNMCLQFLLAEEGKEGSSLFVNFELPIPDVIARFPEEASRTRLEYIRSLFRRRGNLDIHLLLAEVRFIVRQFKIERIAIDGLSSLLATTRQEEYAQLIERLLSTLAGLSGEISPERQKDPAWVKENRRAAAKSILEKRHSVLAELLPNVAAAALKILEAAPEKSDKERAKELASLVAQASTMGKIEHPEKDVGPALDAALAAARPLPTHPITLFITYEPPGDGGVGAADGLHMEIPRLSAMADNILVIRPVMIEDEIHQAIYLAKVRGSSHDRTVRQVRVQSGRAQPVRIEPGLESYTGLLTGQPQPVRLALQLFHENHAEESYNRELRARLREVFKYRVDIFGFSRTAISRTLRELLAPELRFPASHVRVLTIDEWVVQDIDRTSAAKQRRAKTGRPAEIGPLLPLFPFDNRTQPAPDNPLNTRSSDFWAWDIAKGRLKDSGTDLVALPLAADYGMFCINARIAKASSVPGFGKVVLEGEQELEKFDCQPLRKFERAEAWQKLPSAWAVPEGKWFRKPDPQRFKEPDSQDEPALVDYMQEAIEQMALREKKCWGFTFDLATPETAAVFFLELCWSFGATEDVFVAGTGRTQNEEAARWALRLIMYLVKEELMPPEPNIYRSDCALFSRHFYSTFTDCIAPPPEAGRAAAPLVILPFFPFNGPTIVPTAPLVPTVPSEPIEADLKHRIGAIADMALRLPYGTSLPSDSLFSNLPSKPEWNASPDWSGFEVRTKAKSSPGSGTSPTGEKADPATRQEPADLAQSQSAPNPDATVTGESSKGASPPELGPPATVSGGAATPSDADWHDTVEFFRRHARRVEMLKAQRPAGYSCTGLWLVAVHGHTHSAGLSCKLVDEMVSLGSVLDRARLGAGMPARKDFYHVHGADPVPHAPYLTWSELLTDCCSRARQRQRAVGQNTHVRAMNDILYETMRAAIQVAALQKKSVPDDHTRKLADAFADRVFAQMDAREDEARKRANP